MITNQDKMAAFTKRAIEGKCPLSFDSARIPQEFKAIHELAATDCDTQIFDRNKSQNNLVLITNTNDAKNLDIQN